MERRFHAYNIVVQQLELGDALNLKQKLRSITERLSKATGFKRSLLPLLTGSATLTVAALVAFCITIPAALSDQDLLRKESNSPIALIGDVFGNIGSSFANLTNSEDAINQTSNNGDSESSGSYEGNLLKFNAANPGLFGVPAAADAAESSDKKDGSSSKSSNGSSSKAKGSSSSSSASKGSIQKDNSASKDDQGQDSSNSPSEGSSASKPSSSSSSSSQSPSSSSSSSSSSTQDVPDNQKPDYIAAHNELTKNYTEASNHYANLANAVAQSPMIPCLAWTSKTYIPNYSSTISRHATIIDNALTAANKFPSVKPPSKYKDLMSSYNQLSDVWKNIKLAANFMSTFYKNYQSCPDPKTHTYCFANDVKNHKYTWKDATGETFSTIDHIENIRKAIVAIKYI